MTDRARLEELASLCGVETEYYDALGNRRIGSDAAVLSTLRSLGVSVDTLASVPDAIRARRRAPWTVLTEPVAIAWGQNRPRIVVRPGPGAETLRATLTHEGGEVRRFDVKVPDLPVIDAVDVDGQRVEARIVDLGQPLPPGYHRVVVEASDAPPTDVTLIAAPERAHERVGLRAWGAFLPLYALHSDNSLGIGNATDLEALAAFIGELGGNVVGTLPLLSTFLEEPFEYSPYAPVSRLFWNELFVDPARCPELSRSPAALARLESQVFRDEVALLRSGALVDYRRAYALLRPVLQSLSETFFETRTEAELRAFTEANPRADDYARFRAAVETHGAGSRASEDALAGADPRRVRYHLYGQLRASQQLGSACDAAKDLGVGLYLDMPLGVHPDGYDVFREPEAFLTGLSAGAPPDALFTGGQKWGFAPASPEGLRASGYRYLRECLSHQMRGAGVLRLDHVMGLHRLYVIPEEMEATEGVYVRMPHEELYAVAVLESHRHQTLLVGEDLGTVPDAVREAMNRRALSRMYVLPFELRPAQAMIMGEIPAASVASENTHDLPTWQGWWDGSDVDVRCEMGLLSEDEARREKEEREGLAFTLADRLGTPREAGPTLEAALTALAGSDARLLLVNLEDLWLEPAPQNVPGTHRDRPNWRRKAALSLEAMREDPRVVSMLRAIDAGRKRR